MESKESLINIMWSIGTNDRIILYFGYIMDNGNACQMNR